METWAAGEHIKLRLRDRDGVPRGCEPLVVVQDSGDFLVAWMAERFRLPRSYVKDRWRGHGILRLVPFDEPHELILFWRPDGAFNNWYVNFEWPHQRWSRGIDTRDLVLDLIIKPNLQWQWKDQDEFTAATEAGWLSAEEIDIVRQEADRFMVMLDHWPPARYAGCERFRPDSVWKVPDLDDHS